MCAIVASASSIRKSRCFIKKKSEPNLSSSDQKKISYFTAYFSRLESKKMYNLEKWHCFWMIHLKTGKSHLIKASHFTKHMPSFSFFKYFFCAFSASKCKEEKLFGREKLFMQATWNKYFVLRKSYCDFILGTRYFSLLFVWWKICTTFWYLYLKRILKNFKVYPYDLAHLTWPD